MKLHCDITLPASKSESNRALMIAAYGGFVPDFQNLSDSNDSLLLMEALQKLPSIDSNRTAFAWNDIEGNPCIINISDCGTAARFLTTYLACHEGHWLLTGTERMCQRPMTSLVDALRKLDAEIHYVEKEGFLPLNIKGKPLSGGKLFIDMTQSSQFVSSLLLAAPMFPQGLELELLGNLNSLPYLDMTMTMMRHFGAEVERNGRIVIVRPKHYQSNGFVVSADWSAASYWYEMAAFSEECEIRLLGLSLPSMQGDAIIADWMTQLGVGTFVENGTIVLKKIPFEKHSLSLDFSSVPDLYPTLSATCAGLKIRAHFTGLDNLAFKESNRVEAMQMELQKLGTQPLHFNAHNDHRVVMALAPLSMLYGPASFDHPEVVGKSYPKFWEESVFLQDFCYQR